MKKTIDSINSKLCSGCGVCSSVCPTDAILMDYDSEGFICPNIDTYKCINCGLCFSKCPVNEENLVLGDGAFPECYAAWADNDIRLNSSSGGIFSMLAELIWAEGGYVSGAVFSDDYRKVRHIVTDDSSYLKKLQASKYIQSETKDAFNEIKQILLQGKKVLFVGTPCQVAGLKSLIGNNGNLYCVDILCKGVPSTKAYNIYLEEIASGRKISSVAFRDKALWGWSASFKVDFEDGTQYYNAEWLDEPFYQGFLGGLAMRSSCFTCPFASLPRQGDLTLGDFWGIHKKEPSWDDRMGTSMVLVNSETGQKLFSSIRKHMKKVEKISLDFAIENNPAIIKPTNEPDNRSLFFDLLNQHGYTEAIDYVKNNKYDVGIIGFWIGTNYGTVLTNYALNNVIHDLGYRVCMIDPCVGKPRDLEFPVYAEHRMMFEKEYYSIIADQNLNNLNKHIDTFIVGSDQVWNYELTKSFGHVMFLDFVSDERKKIAYASSFGNGHFSDNSEFRRVAAYWLSRFDAISVRERQGVSVCKKQFNVDVTHVLDPVFLCDARHYDNLAKRSKQRIEEQYIFAYILDPTPEKRELLREVGEALGKRIVILLDCEPWRLDENKSKMNMPDNVLDTVFAEDFLSLIMSSDAVITDSYHGTAFSIIFNKPFVSIANPDRGIERFDSLLSLLGLKSRLLYPYDKINKETVLMNLTTKLNNDVYQILEEEKNRSKKWLIYAINIQKKTIDNQSDAIYALNCRIARSERMNQELLKEIDSLKRTEIDSNRNRRSIFKVFKRLFQK